MDLFKPKVEDDNSKEANLTTVRTVSSSVNASELLQQMLELQASLPSAPAPAAVALSNANSDNKANSASALLLSLMNDGAGCQAQEGDADANSLLLMQQLGQSDPSAIARLATSSAEDLKAANIQARALLEQQEEALRNTRLLLQSQLELIEASENCGKAGAPDIKQAPASSPPSPPGAKAMAASPDEKRPPKAREERPKPATEKAEGVKKAPPPKDYDADEGGAAETQYDDDAYFSGFDKEDSQKVHNETFPLRLYRMLYEVEKSGKQDVASFSSDGHRFCVRKPKRFVEEIMPQYFTTKRLASFQRQLNLYGFQRVSEGGFRGSYFHQYFQKGKRALCRMIKRQRGRAKDSAATNNAVASQMAQGLPLTNNFSFTNTLPMAGASPGRTSLVFTNAAAATELLRRATASMELDRALDTRAGLTLQGLLEAQSSAARQASALQNLPAPAPSLISSIQNSQNLRRSFSAPDPAASPPANLQQAMMISRLQRENEELARRLQAEKDASGRTRKRDPV